MKMSRKILLPIGIVLFLAGILMMALATPPVQNYVFEQVPYNYSSSVLLPSDTNNSGSLFGFDSINGKGKNFNFSVILPGAQGYDDPFCYSKDGLNGTGKIDHIQITFDTLKSLLAGDMVGAMFNTNMNGTFTMNCGNWTGTGTFSNNVKSFSGTFVIIGEYTDWDGNFTLVRQDNRIAVIADYIYYPHANKTPENTRQVHKVDYM